MKRRVFLQGIVALSGATAFSVGEQKSGRVYRVALLARLLRADEVIE